MNAPLRSLAVLAVSFTGVAVLTVGLALLIVPGSVGSSQVPDGSASAAPSPPAPAGDLDTVPTAIGGTLVVTGDREVNLDVDREATDGRYGLVGDDARIFLGGDPVSVAQMNLDGLSFFPDPDACEITPGRFNPENGIASALVRCEELADIRDNGVVTVAGVLGVAGDVLGMRGDLPPSGGTASVGDEGLDFDEAQMYAFPLFMVDGADEANMVLVDGDTSLLFTYDVQTHGIALAHVQRGGELVEVAPGDCSISSRPLGMVNPRTTLLDMAVRCPAVELPGVGTVAIDASVVVEEIELTGSRF